MSRYSIEEKAGLYTLRSEDGVEVRVAPHGGFNAYSFRVPHNGEQLHVLIEPQNDEELKKGGFAFGYPILWPFANRIRNGKYTFEGRDYQLDVNWKDGNAIHGLVCNRAWKVTEQGADENKAWISAQFDTRNDADVMRQYPFGAIISCTYSLHDTSLTLETRIENVDDKNLPMTFGIHPWFPLPLTPQGNRENHILKLPANARWQLEAELNPEDEQYLPTGEVLPVDEKYDFRDGQALGNVFLDDVWTQLIYNGKEHICAVIDPDSNLKLSITSSPSQAFREYVVFAPLDRDIICLEPYSSTTNATELALKNIDGGLVKLAPKQVWSSSITTTIKSNT